jgi:flagella basal body P-ring formation protein FlgA
MKWLPLLGGLLLLASPLWGADALLQEDPDKIRISMAESATVPNDEYTLGEIAQIESADFNASERISQLAMGRSPLPGRNLTVTRSLLLSRLRFHRVDVEKLDFVGNDVTQIHRAALKIQGKDVEEAVLAHIEEQYPDQDVQPRILAQIRDVFLPRGELSYDITEMGTYKKEGGYRNYQVNFRVNGELERKVTVRTYLKLYKEVYVARDTIRRDKVIEEADLMKVRRNVDRATGDYVTDPQTLVGKVATRTINPKEVIADQSVVTPPVVRSGDRITIIYDTPNLRLTAPGISMSIGRLGEKIPVRNADSKVVVYAVIQDENTVQVQ